MISPVMIWEFGNGVAVENDGYQLMKVLCHFLKIERFKKIVTWFGSGITL